MAPSAIAFDEGWQLPQALSIPELQAKATAWADAARRAHSAGFRVLELHMAHGYLLHEFLSPLSNQRDDAYGGSLESRMRFPLEVAAAVRAVWPAELPLLVRLSVTDWVPGAWDLEQSTVFARELKALGVDLVDCSSGAIVPLALVPAEAVARLRDPLYQVPFAEALRRDAGIPTAAVGLITLPQDAERIVATGQADLVLLGRELLREPYWALLAGQLLGQEAHWPPQYLRARL